MLKQLESLFFFDSINSFSDIFDHLGEHSLVAVMENFHNFSQLFSQFILFVFSRVLFQANKFSLLAVKTVRKSRIESQNTQRRCHLCCTLFFTLTIDDRIQW